EPGTREEMIRGERIEVAQSCPARADMRASLSYVMRTLAASGYVVAIQLLTRAGPSSDFATDVSVRRQGEDPQTGRRYLEELAFVVVSEQEQEPPHLQWRMEDLSLRGVRRLFAVFVDEGKVCEWSHADQGFVPLPADGALEDPALVIPLPLGALFGSTADRDDVVMSALWAKGNPMLKQLMFASGVRDAIRCIFRGRGLPLGEPQKVRLEACSDVERLERWLMASLTASIDDLLELA
ncbi:MAG: hypothetical protein KC431_00755, partial [Myxococcales bacterium]|nr:hypothetical protein [Myxococcales bacterium]